jgi:regulator of sigma E protease
MNLLLPFVLMSVAYMVPHNIVDGTVVVEEVAPGSPAEAAGIKALDTVVSVNNRPVRSLSDLARSIQLHLGDKINVAVVHADGVAETVTLVPRWRPPAGQGAMGTLSRAENATVVRESLPFWRAIPTGARDCIETLVLYKNGIVSMIIGTVPFVPAGPVGIVQVTGEVAHSGVSPLLELTAFISIAIAITQIIPFPALDGGRIIFVLLEWVRRGKRVSPRIEGIVHSIGFIILLALLILITYQDIFRWASGGSLIP